MVRVSLLVLILWFSAWAQADAVATLDRNSIYENETVTLTISLDGTKIMGGPDVSVLDNDFSVYSQGKSTSSQWINGKGSSTTTWRYILQAKQAGVFTIPAISVGKDKTQALSLQVKRVQNPSGQAQDTVFVELEADKTHVTVQEQIRLTLRVNYAVELSNLSITPLKLPQAKVIEGQESQYHRSIHGRAYRTYEVSYFIYPQHAGELEIPALPIEVVEPRNNRDLMWQTGQRKLLRTQAIVIDVEASEQPGLITAKYLHIEESWSADPSQLEVGDSIQRTIVQKAEGALAEQLNDIETIRHQAMRVYAESPSFENQVTNQGNTGVRTDSMAIVATQPGMIKLPAIEVPWLNSETGEQETATLPAIELHVKGQAISLPDSTVPMSLHDGNESASSKVSSTQEQSSAAQYSQQSSLWLWLWPLSTLLCLLVIAFLSFKLYRRGTSNAVEEVPAVSNDDMAWRQLKKVAANSDALAVKNALLYWAKSHWAGQRVNALADIKRLCADDKLNQQLDALDRALYQGEGKADYLALLAALEKHRQSSARMQGLYPTV